MLRGLAAVSVFLHHLLPHYKAANGSLKFFINISHWGFIGVDLFFVISGFVISSSIFTKERNLHGASIFLKHRFFRVYSAYLPFVVIAIIILYITEPRRLHDIDLLRSITLTTSDMYKHALPVAWSLSYELYFYSIFGLLFFFNDRVLKITLNILFFIIVIRVLFINIPESSNLSFFFSSALFEFFAGVMIFLHKDRLLNRKLIPISLLIIFSGIFFAVGYNIRSGDMRFLIFGISASFTVILALQLEKNSIFTASGLLTKIGDSSYTLYLSHLLFLSALYFSGLRDYLNMQPQLITEWGFVLFIIASIYISHYLYIYFERPTYRYFLRSDILKTFLTIFANINKQLTKPSGERAKGVRR
jgi:exopolysaccharide production protein ExoZ